MLQIISPLVEANLATPRFSLGLPGEKVEKQLNRLIINYYIIIAASNLDGFCLGLAIYNKLFFHQLHQ